MSWEIEATEHRTNSPLLISERSVSAPTSKKRYSDSSVAGVSRRKLNEAGAFEDSDIENLVNETPTKGKYNCVLYCVLCIVLLL